MKRFFETALTAILLAGILIAWTQPAWPSYLFQGAIFALAVAWLACSRGIRMPVLLWAVALIPAWPLAQLALGATEYRWETWNALLYWATGAVVFFLALQVYAEPRASGRFLRTLVVFGCAMSVVATLQVAMQETRVFWLFSTGEPVYGPFVYHNQYAAFIELVLPIALAGALLGRRRISIDGIAAGILFASVIASYSRAGSALACLEVAAAIVCCMAVAKTGFRRTLPVLGIIGLAILIFTVAAGWENLGKRFQQRDPYAARREMFQSSVEMIRARPWTGFGLGTWPTVYPAYARFDDGLFINQAHNDWVQWAAEGGIPFALLILGVVVWAVRPALRSIWAIGLISMAAHAWVDYPFRKIGLMALWFALLGVLASVAKQDPEKEKMPEKC